MKTSIDIKALQEFVAEVMHLGSVELKPIEVDCAWPVYKATPQEGKAFFVKLTAAEPAKRTLSLLKEVKSPLLPRVLTDELFVFGGFSVLCLEWRPSTRVNAEDMNEAQTESFLSGCVELSSALSAYAGQKRELSEENSPRGRYEKLASYAKLHPLCGRLLRPLLALPKEEYDYAGHRLVTIHGDFQPRNYGFDGDRLSAVYDIDDLTQGLACEDATYAFTERLRRSELSPHKRRELIEKLLRVVAASSWPKEEWLLAVNHSRLKIAAKRLAKRPDSFIIAFDILRRDRPLRELADALRRAHA